MLQLNTCGDLWSWSAHCATIMEVQSYPQKPFGSCCKEWKDTDCSSEGCFAECMAMHPYYLFYIYFFSEVLCIFGMHVLSLVMWLGSWRTILSAKPWEKTVGRLQGIVQSESPDGICGRSESQWCRLCLTLPPWGIPTGYKCGGVEDGWEVPRIAMVSCKPHVWGNCRVLGGTSFPSCRSSDDDGEEESAAQGSRQTHDNLYRVHMPSLYSCGSSYGSETSIPAAAHTVSNAPVTEYMWVSWQKGWIASPASCCAQML